jgi:hypothetical protein
LFLSVILLAPYDIPRLSAHSVHCASTMPSTNPYPQCQCLAHDDQSDLCPRTQLDNVIYQRCSTAKNEVSLKSCNLARISELFTQCPQCEPTKPKPSRPDHPTSLAHTNLQAARRQQGRIKYCLCKRGKGVCDGEQIASSPGCEAAECGWVE